MATRPKPTPDQPIPDQRILAELQTLNRQVAEVLALLRAQNAGDLDPGRAVDPGDAVPPGVAPMEPVPPEPGDADVLHALEALPGKRPRKRKPA